MRTQTRPFWEDGEHERGLFLSGGGGGGGTKSLRLLPCSSLSFFLHRRFHVFSPSSSLPFLVSQPPLFSLRAPLFLLPRRFYRTPFSSFSSVPLAPHRNNCSVGFALAPSSSHPAKLATPLLVARASLCRVPFRRRPKQSSVRATETRDTTVRVRRRRRERKRRKEEATAAERRRRAVKPWKRREALAKHDRIESSRAGSRCFEPSRVESSQVEPSRVESRAPCSAEEGWRSNQRGDDYAKGKEAERGRGKGSRARERQRESEINAGDGARGRRTESRQSEDGMGAAGWGKRLRPWLPWRPATNCRRPLLATGR